MPEKIEVKEAFELFLYKFSQSLTQKTYEKEWIYFQEFLETISIPLDFNVFTFRLLALWKGYLEKEKKYKPSTVLKKISFLSSFLHFCVQNQWISQNPLELITRPSQKSIGKTPFCHKDEVQRLLEYLKDEYERMDKTTLEYRIAYQDYVILLTLFTVGLRVSELCQLRICDLEFYDQEYRLVFITKGGEEHRPYISRKTGKILKDYIERFRRDVSLNAPLFIRSQGESSKGLHRSSIFRCVKRVVKKASLITPLSPHGCRVSLATHLHLSDVPLASIQELLNHKNIKTTALYLRRLESGTCPIKPFLS